MRKKGFPGVWGVAYGYDGATVGQMMTMESLGMRLCGVEVTRKRAVHMIEQLKQRLPLPQIAHENIITAFQYETVPPDPKQLAWIEANGIDGEGIRCNYDIHVLRNARERSKRWVTTTLAAITRSRTVGQLDGIAIDCKLAARVLPAEQTQRLREAWKRKLSQVRGNRGV